MTASVLPAVPGTDDSIVHLRLVQPTVLDPGVVCQALSSEPLPWLGEIVDDADLPRGSRRFQADLGFPAAGGGPRPALRKAAYVDLGPLERIPGGCRVAISWRSSSLAPLFPVFAGHLTVQADGLLLEGQYAPPGGSLGALLDHALLGIAARRTAVWLLRAFADACAERSRAGNLAVAAAADAELG